MGRELAEIIWKQTDILYENVGVTLESLTQETLDTFIRDMPVWKHVYHFLHSMDQWFINPFQFHEPDFHEEGLNSLFQQSQKKLDRDQLIRYFEAVRDKNEKFLDALSDEDLGKTPEECRFEQLTLILAQHRHLMYHIGALHGILAERTGEWIKFIGISPPVNGDK